MVVPFMKNNHVAEEDGGSSLVEKEKDAFGVDQEGESTPSKIQ